jgi:hypothetical protein
VWKASEEWSLLMPEVVQGTACHVHQLLQQHMPQAQQPGYLTCWLTHLKAGHLLLVPQGYGSVPPQPHLPLLLLLLLRWLGVEETPVQQEALTLI